MCQVSSARGGSSGMAKDTDLYYPPMKLQNTEDVMPMDVDGVNRLAIDMFGSK